MELRFLCIMSIPDGLCRHAERKLLLRQHMLEKMNAKGYLEPDVVKAQTMEITARLNELKQQRQAAVDSMIPSMIADIRRLQSLLAEIEEPLVEFDEGLMRDTVREVSINKQGEMTVTLLGGLSFTEMPL